MFLLERNGIKMVVREETVVQINNFVKDLGKPMDLKSIHGVMKGAAPLLTAHGSPRSDHKLDYDSYRIKACMGNHLFHAVFKCRFKKVKLMLDRGLDVNMKNSYGYSILIPALHIENNEQRGRMFQFLLNRGAEETAKDRRHDRSILSWAALLGRLEEVKFLLDRFAGEVDLRGKDTEGMTCLHHATHGGHVDVVDMLCMEFRRFGITVDIPDTLGLTPYLHARRLGFNKITKVLMDVGRACPGQGDKFTFRSGREWSDLGAQDRNDKIQTRRFSDFMQAAIFGRSRLLHGFQQPRNVPEIKINGLDELDGPRMQFVTKDKNPGQNAERYYHQSQEHELQKPFTLVYGTPPDTQTPQNGMRALFNMGPRGSKLGDSMNFKRSHAEPIRQSTKSTGQSSHNQQIANMMGILAQQNSTSFRPTVIVPTPEPEVTPRRSKKSTLAILFGHKQKGKKTNRKSPKTDKKSKTTKEKHGKSKK